MKLEPIGGWAGFDGSAALTDALWILASDEEWHYLNFAAGSSLWESRRDASTVGVGYDSGRCIVEFWADEGHASELVDPLVKRFGLVPAASGAA